MLQARLREDDVAAHLGVDPKTVRRWLSGRVPYPSSRVALAELLGTEETSLWPEADGLLSKRSRPEDLAAVYPHRRVIPRTTWTRFFESAEHEIDILAYSALFLAKEAELLKIVHHKAKNGIRVRLALGDPDTLCAAPGAHKDIGNALAVKVRYARTLYRPLLALQSAELRAHRITLYSSIYRSDDQLLVNQHSYGVAAADCPVFSYRRTANNQLFTTYVESFEAIWSEASPTIRWLTIFNDEGYVGV